MTSITVKPISTLKEYTEFFEQITQPRWFRGCCEGDDLTPSLYRHPINNDPDSLFKQEMAILKRFKQRSIPYIGNSYANEDDLNLLFIMQHFGVPTRLLDWTESPYIALYFALTGARYKKTTGGIPDYDTNVHIWVLDPITWNGKALDLAPPPGIISPPDNDLLNGYLPGSMPYRKPEPVALYGIYNNPRIVVQRGVFTLFGANTKPMEVTYVENNYPQDSLLKMTIAKNHVGDMLNALSRIGITDSVVFPDLPGLAKELKRQFGYWV